MEKPDWSSIAGGNIKWHTHSGKRVEWSLTKINMLLPYNPAIALLGIHPQEMKIYVQIKTCTCMFTAALLVKAKNKTTPMSFNG